MQLKIVKELYEKVISLDSGCRLVKFDLHIHTPASKCYNIPDDTNADDIYLSILDEAIDNELEIIAITDHNSFDGYNRIIELLKNSIELQKKYKKLLILCGIEITTYSNHILAIFNSEFLQQKQDMFLRDIGIDFDLRGKSNAMADELSPTGLFAKIGENGGFVILAHADTNKGFLYSKCRQTSEEKPEMIFEGNSLTKIIKSPYLYGIQVTSQYGKEKVSNLFKNREYKRTDRSLPLLHFSDSHSLNLYGNYNADGKAIGTEFSIAKLSNISFDALKLALGDADIRITYNNQKETRPYIIGCSIKSGIIKEQNTEFANIKFNAEMNCIIGARGTGKSTMLNIIKDVIFYDFLGYDELYEENDYIKNLRGRYSVAIVFVEKDSEIYAICNDFTNWKAQRALYKKSVKTNTFAACKHSEFLTLFLAKMYMQRDLYKYSQNPNSIMEIIDNFVMWKHYEEYSKLTSTILQCSENIRSLFGNNPHKKSVHENMDYKDIKTYLTNYEKILSSKNRITELRESFIKSINKILKDKVELKLTYTFEKDAMHCLTWELPKRVAQKAEKHYEYECEIRKLLKSLVAKSKMGCFNFIQLLVRNDIQGIIETYKMNDDDNTKTYLANIGESLSLPELMVFMDNGLELNYNVNYGVIKNVKFMKSQQLSLGQHAVALLLIILNASQKLEDNRPLIMDQPEDDLDNSYIYDTLVKDFRDSKSRRQMIISTHNPNIPVAADAENIIVLKYNGEHGYIDNNGAIDKPQICERVLGILEGGHIALNRRKDKYEEIIHK